MDTNTNTDPDPDPDPDSVEQRRAKDLRALGWSHREFAPLEHAFDRESVEQNPDREPDLLYVLAYAPDRASEHEITATGQTVAEHNPTYPADDPVVIAAYESGLHDAFGDRWEVWPVDTLLYAILGGGRGRTYSFPESRLTDDTRAVRSGEAP